MRCVRLRAAGWVAMLAAFTLCFSPAAQAQQLPPDYAAALKTWTYSLAMTAAEYGAPLVTMYALRDNDAVGAKAKAKPNTVWRMEDISTPELSKEAGYVTPNVNVIYGFGFLDLRQEPVIVKAPESKPTERARPTPGRALTQVRPHGGFGGLWDWPDGQVTLQHRSRFLCRRVDLPPDILARY